MKKIIAVLIVFLSVSYSSAASCTDIPKNLFRYQESSTILSLQNFLFEKGYLKNKPNGYFGAGTLGAVKLYQKSLGLEQVGSVGPATRAAIKKETCGAGTTTTKTTAGTTPTTSAKPAVTTPKTPQAIRNDKRRDDIETILKGLYRYFVDSRGVHALKVSDTPIDLCVAPPSQAVSVATSATAVVVVETPASPCADYVDIAYLSPSYLKTIPRDPSLSTSSIMTGYTITRSEFNDITIAAKNPEDGAIIKVTCNFNGFCQEIKRISTIIYKRPIINSINRNILLRDAYPRTPLILRGENFTATNTVKFFSLYNSREYTIGTFASTYYTATTTALPIEGSYINQSFPCGGECTQKLPLGDYSVTITNEGGVSNPMRVVMRGFTTSTISTQVNSSIIPTTKNVKVASITLSSSVPVSLKSLVLTSSSTSKNLSSKISNFVLKDASDGTTYSGGSGSFSFSNINLYENQSKVYDVYIDTAEVYNEDAGFITYGGKFLVNDTFSYVDMEIPIKEFSFTVSH
jgi:hypothetical protein